MEAGLRRFASLVLVFCLLVLMMPVSALADSGGNICEIVETGTGYATLDAALDAVQSGQTIKLLGNIDYNGGIKIENRSITFNLNGFTLNVNNTGEETPDTFEDRSGLYVSGNSVIGLEGEGEFNVTGLWYGVFAEKDRETDESPEVTVTNAAGIKKDGVFAQGGAKVYIRGDVTSSGDTSDGNDYYGIYATDSDTEVYVDGDVIVNGDSLGGVFSEDYSHVEVKGSVIVNGSESIGVKTGFNGDVSVNGNIFVTGDKCTGLYILRESGVPSTVTVMGEILTEDQDEDPDNDPYFVVLQYPTYNLEYTLSDFLSYLEIRDNFIIFEFGDSIVSVCATAGGDGSAGDPFLIANATQLFCIGRNVERYTGGYHFLQVADIDLGGFWSLGPGWEPIGHGELPFVGYYDGNGYTISNLYMYNQRQSGLFGCIGYDSELRSEVRNVKLVNVDIKVNYACGIGALAGSNYGIVENSYASGTINGEYEFIGGLVGENHGSIINSGFEGTVISSGQSVGGLVGYNSEDRNEYDDFEEGFIENCYAEVTVFGTEYVGGLVGGNAGRITESHAVIHDIVDGNKYAGGLVGDNGGTINDSYADGNVEGYNSVGGLAGRNEGEIYDANFTGEVTNRGSLDYNSGLYTGGLVGENRGFIVSSFAHAEVRAPEGYYVGGLAGLSEYSSIEYSGSDGSVEGGRYVGGLVGGARRSYAYMYPRLYASYSNCLVTGERYVGGLVGANGGMPVDGGSEVYEGYDIERCFAKGDVENTSDRDITYEYFGGLAGKNTGNIYDSYAWGNVDADDFAGGLIGHNEGDVYNCYAIGNVTVAESSNVGPLIGYSVPEADIIGTFWNVNTSGHNDSKYGIKSDPDKMKNIDTYNRHHGDEYVDWDFETVWGIDTGTYPYLRWEKPGDFESGTGTEEDPYIITTEEHLDNVRKYLNKHFRLAADLDLENYRSGSGWEPIGTENSPFTGSFDGDEYSISNLYIRKDYVSDYETVYSGLFGFIGNRAVIRDLTLEGMDIQADGVVGGLAAVNLGTLENCIVEGDVTSSGDDYLGRDVCIGGLVAENRGTIINCYALANVTGGDDEDPAKHVGGLAGRNYGSIRKSASSRTVTGGDMVGGLVGLNTPGDSGTGEITECFSGSIVTGYGDYAGGLVGRNNGPITRSFAYGIVTGRNYVGGLAGWNDDKITDSYAVNHVTGADHTGGLVGHNTDLLTNCYSAGAVTRVSMISGVYFGGLVGYKGAAGGDEGAAVNSWWDIDASGQEGSANGEGRTTAEMKMRETFENWDFITVWDIIPDINNGYPVLRWVDEIPPVLSDAKLVSASNTSAVLSFNTNKSGRYYYLLYTPSPIHTAPSAEEVRAQGDDCAAKGTGAAAAGVNEITLTGLQPGQLYIAYIIVEYNQDNISNVVQADFRTVSESADPSVVPLSLDLVTGETKLIYIYLGAGERAAESAEVTNSNTDVAAVNPSVVSTTNQSVAVTGLSAGSTTLNVSFIGGGYTGGDITVDVNVTTPASCKVRFFDGNELYDEITVRKDHAAGDDWPKNPVKIGYTFGGWYTGQNGTGVQHTKNTIISRDTDLYAKWTYSGGTGSGFGGGGGGASVTAPPHANDHIAIIKAGTAPDTEAPIKVNNGIALIESGLPDVIPPVTVVKMPPIPDAKNYAVGIPVPSLTTEDVEGTLTLETEAGSVTVPSNMLTGVEGKDGQKAQISIGNGDKADLPANIRGRIGNRPLIQLSLSVDGKQINWNNPNAPVSVSIPYTPSATELASPESIVVWYIDGSGNAACVPNGRYDPDTGMVTFTVTHFSYYAVVFNILRFNDVAEDAWYSKAVNYIAARDITIGTGDGKFSPDVKLTRAQFLVMVMRAYGIAPDGSPGIKDNFADAGDAWYSDYLAAAKRLGISNGVGNNMFAPEKEITRQEMFTLLYNTLKAIGSLPRGKSGKTLSDFSDADEIAAWAKEPMRLLVKAGMIAGSGGRLNPLSTATRAEMAQILYNLFGK